jgi:predicted DNA-binding transcriptional regulator YafY
MGEHLVMERYYWFDSRVRANLFPNARSIADNFEISPRTARRNIAFMRDRLMAPLEYNPCRKGYQYADNNFCLPPLPVSQEELISILIARDLLSGSAEGLISRTIQSFGRKLFAAMDKSDFSEKRFKNTFSAVWNGHSPAQADIFRTVLEALLRNRLLECGYSSPGTARTTERKIEPHHLQHYMGSWVLIGYCHLRRDWRKFFLSRMSDPLLIGETFEPRTKEEWEPMLQSSFGIFQGGKDVPVTLRFNPFRARWIREQMWHPAQALKELPDGGLELSFPVVDFREVKLKILQFGADVEVVEPKELREGVKEEIQKMVKIYETGES